MPPRCRPSQPPADNDEAQTCPQTCSHIKEDQLESASSPSFYCEVGHTLLQRWLRTPPASRKKRTASEKKRVCRALLMRRVWTKKQKVNMPHLCSKATTCHHLGCKSYIKQNQSDCLIMVGIQQNTIKSTSLLLFVHLFADLQREHHLVSGDNVVVLHDAAARLSCPDASLHHTARTFLLFRSRKSKKSLTVLHVQ